MVRSFFGYASLALLMALVAGSTAAQTPAGGEFRINVVTAGAQIPTGVASNATGGFVVVWQTDVQDGDNTGVFARRYDAAGNPGSEFQVNQFFTGGQSVPAVGAAPDGRFVAAWQSANQDGNGLGIFARRYNAAGAAVGAEFRVNTTVLGAQQRASVAMASNGSFVVVWDSPDAQNAGVFGQRYNASGGALGGEFPINIYTLSNQMRARVASAEDGRFVVVWDSQNQDGSSLTVMGRRYDASGNAQGGEFQVNTYTTMSQGYPAISMTADGRFVVVWASYTQDGRFWGVFGQRYDASGAPQGPEFQVNTFSTASQSVPGVAMAEDGSFAVTWRTYQQEGAGGAGIRGQMFDATGSASGYEFAVNTYTTNLQGTPFMSSAPNGAFVVVWQSSLQDGSSFGAFGQRYQVSDLIFEDGFEL
jgi:hypothetical protein